MSSIDNFESSDYGYMPFINSDNAGFLLKNPNRGLRGETYITLGENIRAYPGENDDPFERAERLIKKYEPDSPTVFQTYVYLCDYSEKLLDDLAFEQLKKFFEIFEKHGIRILLRFAYSTESTPDVPYQTTKTHLSQIGKWFRENEALIKNVLFCLQTGIIGYWGEGHSYRKFKKRYIKNTIEDVCRIAPAGIYNQIRTYSMLKKVPIEYSTVVGIHDDYITGDTAHKWAFVKSTNKRRYAEVTNHARFTVNDGEMPWGRAYLNDKKILGHCDHFDGIEVLKQLKAYSLTTFSLEHNYREDEGKSYSMQKWKNVMLSYSECVGHGLTVNPELFKDKNNNSVKQSVYDIIRYHLGYHIAVKDLFITENEFFFALINYGFAPPLTFNYFAAVFEGKDGSIKEIPFENYNKNALLSGKTVSFKASVPYGCKPLGLKMETEQGSGICARFANDTEFKNGIMYFK